MRNVFESIVRDVRYASRALAHDPGFTVVAIATLALGLGANTAIFAVLYNAVLRPLPYERADSLVHVRRFVTTDERGPRPSAFSYENFVSLSRETGAFEVLAAYGREPLTLGGRHAERVIAEIVSPAYLSMLGVTPAVGRAFDSSDDRAGAEPVVLLSHALWRSRFAGQPDIAGRPVRLNGIALTVAGVAHEGFKGDSGGAELWIPARTALDVLRLEPSFEIIGRLGAGVPQAQASGEVRDFVARLPRSARATVEGIAVPLASTRRDPKLGAVLAVLYGAVTFIVLIACANVANLLLARGIRRGREIAIRLSLGAGRGAILRQLLTESLLLAVAGAGAGLLLAVWILDLLAALQPAANAYVWPTFARGLDADAFTINPTIILFSGGLAIATTIIFGVLPARVISRPAVRDALNTDATSWGLRRGGAPWRALVAAQVALVLVLLAGAGLMLRSFGRLVERPIGIDPHGITTFRVSLPFERYKGPEAAMAFFARLDERIAALPSVESVTRLRHLPLIERGTVTTLRVEGSEATYHAGFNAVDPEFFRLFGVTLREGRFFTATDGAGTPPVAILTETAARNLFGTASAIGRRITAMGPAEVVGVIADIRYEPQRPQLPIVGDVYVNMRQRPAASAYIALRTGGNARDQIAVIRATVAELDPELPIFDVTTMSERLRSVQSYARFTTMMLTAFAAVALALALIGIYGTVGYAVASRRREVGIRMALGATRASVVGLFLRDGLAICAAGAAAGLVLAFPLMRTMRSVLFETAPTDPVAFAAACVVIGIAAAAACTIPARRAASVDPSITLRQP